VYFLRDGAKPPGAGFATGIAAMAIVTRLICALLITFVLSTCAFATDDASIAAAREWGLLGTWAIDCTVPIRDQNGNMLSIDLDSAQQLVYRRYHKRMDVNPITNITIQSEDKSQILLTVWMPKYKATRENLWIRDSDGNVHTGFNRSKEDGTYSIKDGLFIASGKPAPIFHKCDYGF
jgi:hypothetical protein